MTGVTRHTQLWRLPGIGVNARGVGSGVLGVSRADGMRGSCLQRKRLDGLPGLAGYAPVAAVRSRKMTCS